VAPSDAASKNCNIGAQQQSLTCIIAPKLFWKIYFLYDFWCTQTFLSELLFRYLYEVWQLLSALYSDLRKKIIQLHTYILGPKLLQWKFFSNISAMYTKWCAQTFPPIFGIFAILDRNFAKIVAPPSNDNDNYVVHLKEQSILKKSKRQKLYQNRPINRHTILVWTMCVCVLNFVKFGRFAVEIWRYTDFRNLTFSSSNLRVRANIPPHSKFGLNRTT